MDENPDLNGEDVVTPAGSQPGTTTPDGGSSVNQDGARGTLSPEEVSWNDLSGGSQDRFRAITRDLNEYRRKEQEWQEEKLRLSATNQSSRFSDTSEDPNNPEVQDAIRRLSKFGIATKEDVQAEIGKYFNGFVYRSELEKLESRFDGSNGLPKFDRNEYEDYIARYPQYRSYEPSDVYEKMYADEILDSKLQDRNGGTTSTSQTANSSLRPTRTQVQQEPWTPELIEQKLQSLGPSERIAWLEKNRDKINTVLSNQSSS